jgi:hypothetical protein
MGTRAARSFEGAEPLSRFAISAFWSTLGLRAHDHHGTSGVGNEAGGDAQVLAVTDGGEFSWAPARARGPGSRSAGEQGRTPVDGLAFVAGIQDDERSVSLGKPDPSRRASVGSSADDAPVRRGRGGSAQRTCSSSTRRATAQMPAMPAASKLSQRENCREERPAHPRSDQRGQSHDQQRENRRRRRRARPRPAASRGRRAQVPNQNEKDDEEEKSSLTDKANSTPRPRSPCRCSDPSANTLRPIAVLASTTNRKGGQGKVVLSGGRSIMRGSL